MKRNYLNLSLRSIFHLFVSGSLFYFFRQHFNIGLSIGILGAFTTGVCNEVFEHVRKIETSFHTRDVFIRDRTLVALSVIYTGVIVALHSLFATLAAPVSLMLLTSYMDKKAGRGRVGERNLIKPAADIASLTLGPIACILFLKLVH